jgi:hypothetical protein
MYTGFSRFGSAISGVWRCELRIGELVAWGVASWLCGAGWGQVRHGWVCSSWVAWASKGGAVLVELDARAARAKELGTRRCAWRRGGVRLAGVGRWRWP